MAFMSLLVSTLPNGWEDQVWRQLPNDWINLQQVTPGKDRRVFPLTAVLHEQYIRWFCPGDGDYASQIAGALPCSSEEYSSHDGKDGNCASKPKCWIIQPVLSRNIILRNRVIAETKKLDPDLEEALRAKSIKRSEMEYPPNQSEVLNKVGGIHLEGRNFEYADFSGSSFPKGFFIHTKFQQAKLRNTRWDEADFSGDELPNSQPPEESTDIDAKRSEFTGADLNEADLTNAQLPKAKMSKAYLGDATLISAQLPGADLSRAHLSGAQMNDARLPGAVITQAYLKEADLSHADLSGAILRKAHFEEAELIHTNLQGADLSESHLEGSKMHEANLSNSLLVRAFLSGADLTNVQLVNANLSDAWLDAADLSNTRIENGVFDYAHMAGAVLYKVLLYNTSLAGSDLTGASVEQTDLLGIDFSDANLEGTRFMDLKSAVIQDLFGANAGATECWRNTPEPSICKDERSLPQVSRISPLNELYMHWVSLACQDTATPHWIARKMVKRATEKESPLLAKATYKAVQEPGTCPGLANLPEAWMARLRQAAERKDVPANP